MSGNFLHALRGGCALIAEIKAYSPEAGDLLRRREPAAIAAAYARAGAAALSVTTGRWHRGRIGMIADIAATGRPVLRKDFITTRGHVDETAAAGASAVLLTCALLRPKDVAALIAHADAAGLTAFIEAADERELDALPDLRGAHVLAINNRDIRRKEMDGGGVETALSLYARARLLRPGALVSASGMRTPDDAARAAAAGFDGVLVGTALMRDPRGPETAARGFLRALRTPCAA